MTIPNADITGIWCLLLHMPVRLPGMITQNLIYYLKKSDLSKGDKYNWVSATIVTKQLRTFLQRGRTVNWDVKGFTLWQLI